MQTAPITVQQAAFPEAFLPLTEPHRYKICYGSRAGARSWSIARWLLCEASHLKLRILCTREYQKTVRESVHRLLSDQIRLLGLPHWTIQQADISCRNGSKFIFCGLRHKPEEIKSMEGIDRVWVEEAETASRESLDLLIPTIRKDRSELIFSFNPDDEEGAVWQRFIVNPPPDTIKIFTTWRDNPFFPEVLKAERDYMWATDPDRARHIWDGECRKQTQAAILGGKWIKETFEPGEDWDGPYYGADWGFSQDPNALVKCWVYERKLFIEYEAYAIGVELDHTPAMFREVPGSPDYTILADSARPETISYMRRHGFPLIMPVPKWHGSVEDGVEFLRSFEQIVIHPRCPHMADEAKNYSYKVDPKTKLPTRIIADKHNHLMDSLRYALAPLIQVKEIDLAPLNLA